MSDLRQFVINRKREVILLGLLLGASALLFLVWLDLSKTVPGSALSPGASSDLEPLLSPSPQGPVPETTGFAGDARLDPAEGARQEVAVATDAGGTRRDRSSYASEQGEGLIELQRLAQDRYFLEAGAKDMDVKRLRALVTQANRVVAMAVKDLADYRVAAGLYKRLPGYAPGVSFTPERDNRVLGGIMISLSGEALQIDLEREEYPDLYMVSDRLGLLEEELETRERVTDK